MRIVSRGGVLFGEGGLEVTRSVACLRGGIGGGVGGRGGRISGGGDFIV